MTRTRRRSLCRTARTALGFRLWTVVAMAAPDEAAVAAALAQAVSAENQRRRLAADRPGHGALMRLPQPPAGPGVGLSDNPLPVVGEGYSVAPGASEAQVASYTTPNYADPSVGGVDFVGGRNEAPIKRHAHDLGDSLFVGVPDASRTRGDGFTVVSPQRPGLLSRLRARFRKG